MLSFGCRSSASAPLQPAQAAAELHLQGHPRLWVRAADLPRLRGWASSANPFWGALVETAEAARDQMSHKKIPSGDACTGEDGSQTCEAFAELFAFMSLVHPSDKERKEYAARAVTLLMAVIDHVARVPADKDPLTSGNFPVDNRSRWSGEAFGLTVDWIYPSLSAEQKRTIRKVFLQWCKANSEAQVTDNNHPEPIGVVDDPQLIADKAKLRWAGNNYFTAHARNLALMALSLDAADDPDHQLQAYAKLVTGAWLYVIDAYLRGDGAGGLPADGFEYGPQSLGYLAQALWALHTAGVDDAKIFGRQARLDANPFWSALLQGWPATMAPAPVAHPWMNQVYQPAWWADGQHDWAPEGVELFAPIALYDRDLGDRAGADAAQWIAVNLSPGLGAAAVDRARKPNELIRSLLYFLLMDPKAPAPADPRRGNSFVSTPLGRIFARTDWSPQASFFSFDIGWASVDHQHGDGNAFSLFRKGEWLTKGLTGYGDHAAASYSYNTVSIQNAKPAHTDAYREVYWKFGSQYILVADGAGKLVAHTETPRYVYALGDATDLFNSEHEGIKDVAAATRAILWLSPDHVVVFDRAATRADGRFKRFYLNTPTRPSLHGRQASMKTPKGQYLHITSLLPADAKLTVSDIDSFQKDERAENDPISARLCVESWSREVEFLHVLQASDRSAVAEPTLVDAGRAFVAVAVRDVVAVFPRQPPGDGGELSLVAPAAARALVVTGLQPNGEYHFVQEGRRLGVVKGSGVRADRGGVLWVPIS